MKVLFLDVDGVLNSLDFVNRNQAYKSINGRTWEEDGGNVFVDPEAVKRVIHICNQCDVKIVLSSSWRLWKLKDTIDSLENYRDLKPIAPYLVGVTPRLKSGHRGTEIATWLSEHPEVTDYVIVDDDSDMTDEQKASHFVQTNFNEGLDFRKSQEIYQLFKKETCSTTTY